MFVEDEVTTGNTILNIINILDREYTGKFKYSVASLLNGMDKEYLEQYRKKGIPLHYLIKTDHSDYSDRAEKLAEKGHYYKCSDHTVTTDYMTINISGRMDARRMVDSEKYGAACEKLWTEIQTQTGSISGKKILVIGTEEFMFPVLYIGRQLEKEGNSVRCHSTTRSPIVVSLEREYPLHSRYELKSLYDPDRRTFLYDIEKYDKVFVITDSPEIEEGQRTLINALQNYNDDITVVRWC